jgi:hypothetical protein
MMSYPLVQTLMYLACMLMTLSCGDTLKDAQYRGEPLLVVTGIIEPAPEFDGAQYVCSFEWDECYERCFEENQSDFFEDGQTFTEVDDAESFRAMNACWDGCATSQEVCLQDYEGTDFASAYYNKDISHRIAIIWANPSYHRMGRSTPTGQSILQQRSVTSTGFPARYSFSVYQPPPAAALFELGDVRYAYGIIVTYHDFDGDEMLDIVEEPIIGFSVDSGILYTSQATTDEAGLEVSAGYRIYTASFACGGSFLEVQPPEVAADGTNLAISGASPAIFDRVPDVGCDDSHVEWLDLCGARTHSARCATASAESVYASICRFCRGDSSRVDHSEVPAPGGEQEPDETPLPDDGLGMADESPCDEAEMSELELCEAEQDRQRCLEEAQDDLGRSECEAEFERRNSESGDQGDSSMDDQSR